jgi:DNA-binding response OmpR family regulator
MVILLIEDEPKQSEFIATALEQAAYVVDTAYDGEEALKKIEVCDYDLMIVDLHLPKVSGEELIVRIRELKLTVPILVLTANDNTDTKVLMLNTGADDYLTKPFALDELLARVRALMRRPAAVTPHIFIAGKLELLYGTHEIKVAEKIVKLTHNEFRLLDFLAHKPDRVCTRAMIEEHVWGYNVTNESNVIEVVVYNLRRKLGPQIKKYIQTVPNIGYRFKPE